MTAYPPPPPTGPPPAGYGAPRPGFDPKSVHPLDWASMVATLLALIFSFFAYYTYDIKSSLVDECQSAVKQGIVSASACESRTTSAWIGFFGWFALLLAVLAALALGLELFAPHVQLPVPGRLAGVGGLALGVIFTLLALVVVPDYDGGGAGYDQTVDEGHGFSYWVVLLLLLVALVAATVRLLHTGRAGLSGAMGGSTPYPGAPAGPAPGYGPPPGPPEDPAPGYGPPPGQ